MSSHADDFNDCPPGVHLFWLVTCDTGNFGEADSGTVAFEILAACKLPRQRVSNSWMFFPGSFEQLRARRE